MKRKLSPPYIEFLEERRLLAGTVPHFSESATAVVTNGAAAQSVAAPIVATSSQLITPTITWPTPAPITYGTPISSAQLNAKANVPGTFTYFVTAGTILPAGTQPLAVQFTPTDTTKYASAIADVNLVINKADPKITWPTPAPITYGTALSATQLNATADVAGSFSYSISPGTVLAAGTQTVTVAFTPSDQGDYNTVLSSVSLVINKATPTLTWATPAPITFGMPLNGAQLNASANIAGTFSYSVSPGTVLSAGTHAIVASFTPTNTADYAITTKTVNLVVNKSALTVTWPVPAPVPYGTPISATQLNATANVPGTFGYNIPLGTIFHPGTVPLTVVFSPTDSTDYAPVSTTVNLVIFKATPTLTWPTPAPITYGVTLNGAQLNASVNVAGTLTYNFPVGTLFHPGVQSLTANFTPSDTVDYITATASVSLVVNKAVPVIIWPTPVAITYGTALNGTQLNATANVPGSLSYSVSPGTVLAAGTQPLTVAFTPTDTTDYATATATVNLVVNKATPTVTWPVPAPITYGTAISATQLNATASVAGSFSYSVAAGTVLSAGTRQLIVNFTPANATDYSAVTSSVNLVVNKATPTVTWTAPAQISYGTALSGTQLNATASVSGTFAYNYTTGTIFYPGTYSLSVTFTPTDTTDYTPVIKGVSLVVVKATPALTWAVPSPIIYGAVLSATQLDASANVPGTISYNFPLGTLFHPGTQPLTASFTPTDTTDYNTATASVNLVISKASPVLTWAVPAAITYGTAVTATQLNASSNIPGSLSYSVSPGTILSAGVRALTVAFTPTDTIDYNTGTATVSLLVNKATSVLTWPTPAPIDYGTGLSGTQLNATANVPGNFTYNYPPGTVFHPGMPVISVGFTPTDSTDYTITAATVTLDVTQAKPTLTWNLPAPITFGTALSGTQLNASANVPGTYSYGPIAGTKPGVGIQALSVIFTPTDTTDYITGFASVNLTVAQATPVITWPVPAPITLGTSLGNAQLNATANVAGAFVYTPAAGTVPTGGVQSLSLTFTPTDTADYTTATASVRLIVNSPLLPTPVITWPTPAAVPYGTPLSNAQLDAMTNVPGGFTYNVASGAVLSVGTHALSVTFNPSNPASYNAASASVNLVVTQAQPIITWPTPAPIAYGDALGGAELNATANTPGTFAYSIPAGTLLHPGTHPLSVTFTPTDSADYTTTAATVNLVVSQATPAIAWPVPAPITYGNPLSDAQLNASANTTGSYVYNIAAGTVLPAGTQSLSVTFTPTDSTDYAATTADVSLVVAQAMPQIIWPAPAPITYGAALSATQLNATANLPGTFAYNAAAGTVFHAGVQPLSLTFTPTDSTDYATVEETVNLTVNTAPLVVTAADARCAPGGANPPFTYSISGFVNGDTAAVVSGKPILSTTADAASASGSYPITIDPNTLAAADYAFNLIPGTLLITVGSAPSNIASAVGRVSLPASVIAGESMKATIPVVITNGGANLAGVYTLNIFANTDNALDGGEVLVATATKKMSLHAGKHAVINQRLNSLPADLPEGNYYLIAEVTDPAGQISVAPSSQTVEVQKASVGLSISAGPVKPATIHAGKSGSLSVTVTNNGSVAAAGTLIITLSQTSDGISPGMTLASVMKTAKISPHRHKSFVIHFPTAGLSAGTYLSYLSASLGGGVATTVGPSIKVM